MKTILRILPLLTILMFISCNESEMKYGVLGTEKYYESWGWDEFVPQRMEHTLELDWNEDCIVALKESPVTLELKTLDLDGNEVAAKDVVLYVNGEICDKNRFEVTTKDKELSFAIEFKKDATEGSHIYFLEYVTANGSERLIDEIAFENFGVDNRLQAEREIIMNPLKEKVLWATSIFLAVCLLWYIVSRFFIWRSTSFSKITLTYSDGTERVIRMRGGYELVCTSNRKDGDSLLKRIFLGSRQYEYDAFWTHPVRIGRGRKRNSLSIIGARYYSVVGEKMRRTPIEIINENGVKVIIETT